MTYFAIINTNTNICENVTVDDRPANEIPIPAGYIIKDLSTIPAMDWVKDQSGEWIQVGPTMGEGGKGDIWDGTMLIQPKPV
jgi:hypothetical protein